MASNYVFNDILPVVPLKLAALESCKEPATKVYDHIITFRRNDTEELLRRKQDLNYRGYDVDSYLLDCKCPRFGSGEAKAVINESVRGVDLFAMADVTNYSIPYSVCGYTNREDPEAGKTLSQRWLRLLPDDPVIRHSFRRFRMKRFISKITAFAVAFTLFGTSTAFAGTWTHANAEGREQSWLWFYMKEDGSYAKQEWVNDNGTWYWLGDDGAIPLRAGIADDGSLYNGDGVYVPTNDGIHHFVDKAMYSQLQEGMSPDQVVSILGQPHELCSTLSSDFGANHFDYATYKWYASNPNSYIYITYTNGAVSSITSYWHPF